MHLYDETLDRYLERDLPPWEVSAIDAHVSNCLPCAHALADRHGESGGWVRRGLLGRLVRLDERSPDGAGADAGAEIEKRRAEAA